MRSAGAGAEFLITFDVLLSRQALIGGPFSLISKQGYQRLLSNGHRRLDETTTAKTFRLALRTPHSPWSRPSSSRPPAAIRRSLRTSLPFRQRQVGNLEIHPPSSILNPRPFSIVSTARRATSNIPTRLRPSSVSIIPSARTRPAKVSRTDHGRFTISRSRPLVDAGASAVKAGAVGT